MGIYEAVKRYVGVWEAMEIYDILSIYWNVNMVLYIDNNSYINNKLNHPEIFIDVVPSL